MQSNMNILAYDIHYILLHLNGVWNPCLVSVNEEGFPFKAELVYDDTGTVRKI